MKKQWEIIQECNTDDGQPTQWCKEINHYKYGRYVWINYMKNYFSIEVDHGGFIELKQCKSLASAKKWVTMNLL